MSNKEFFCGLMGRNSTRELKSEIESLQIQAEKWENEAKQIQVENSGLIENLKRENKETEENFQKKILELNEQLQQEKSSANVALENSLKEQQDVFQVEKSNLLKKIEEVCSINRIAHE